MICLPVTARSMAQTLPLSHPFRRSCCRIQPPIAAAKFYRDTLARKPSPNKRRTARTSYGFDIAYAMNATVLTLLLTITWDVCSFRQFWYHKTAIVTTESYISIRMM